MSLNFAAVRTNTWIGQVSSQPAGFCAVPNVAGQPGKGPRIVRQFIDWQAYPEITLQNILDFGVTINIVDQQVAQPLTRIASVYVDNLGSFTPIYVVFPDTGFCVVAGPNRAGWMPVVTNGVKAVVYGVGFIPNAIPQTTVYYTDYFVPPSGDLQAESAVTVLPIVEYRGAANVTTATATIDSGTTGFERALLLGVSTYTTNQVALTSVNLSGVGNMALYNSPVVSGNNICSRFAIIADNVAGNRTFTLGFSGAPGNNGAVMLLWKITNLNNLIPYGQANTPAVGANPACAFPVATRGIAFGLASAANFGAPPVGVSFNGLPLDYAAGANPGNSLSQFAYAGNNLYSSLPGNVQISAVFNTPPGNAFASGISFARN